MYITSFQRPRRTSERPRPRHDMTHTCLSLSLMRVPTRHDHTGTITAPCRCAPALQNDRMLSQTLTPDSTPASELYTGRATASISHTNPLRGRPSAAFLCAPCMHACIHVCMHVHMYACTGRLHQECHVGSAPVAPPYMYIHQEAPCSHSLHQECPYSPSRRNCCCCICCCRRARKSEPSPTCEVSR